MADGRAVGMAIFADLAVALAVGTSDFRGGGGGPAYFDVLSATVAVASVSGWTPSRPGTLVLGGPVGVAMGGLLRGGVLGPGIE